jgi:protein prenyltransferase alpha subunit repeat containing protein 1
MSRALDRDIASSLNDRNHLRVFHDISATFARPQDGRLTEVEFLGRSHPLEHGLNLVRDGNAVAIPKLRLVQAFIPARQILKNHIQHGQHTDAEVLGATAVILLMDPEHLTATNIRKKILRSRLSPEQNHMALLVDEKYFVDSIITSRLHRHTKSPVLWSHRRWLLQQFKDFSCLAAINLPGELRNVVMVSGERHTRNYYAWNHARWLVQTFGPLLADSSSLQVVLRDVKVWCFKHHNDISGWTFLRYLLDIQQARKEDQKAVVSQTLDLTSSLQWRNESVWWFLRGLVSGDLVEVDVARLKEVRKMLEESAAEESMDRKVLALAEDWIDKSEDKQVKSEAIMGV